MSTPGPRPGWAYLGEEPYWFDHWDYGGGPDFRQVTYDFGAWYHPRAEEPDMDNIREFVSDYPPGWYWTRSVEAGVIMGGGPFTSRDAAMLAAEQV